MNSCCDLDLILVSGSGACMCHVSHLQFPNPIIKKVRVQDGGGI